MSESYVTLFTVQEEVEERKKNKVLAEKVKMEMGQKIEEVSAKIIALQQKNMALEDAIRQKTAKRQNLVSKVMQVCNSYRHTGYC
jgi:methionine-rich copper-binding protein CopC